MIQLSLMGTAYALDHATPNLKPVNSRRHPYTPRVDTMPLQSSSVASQLHECRACFLIIAYTFFVYAYTVAAGHIVRSLINACCKKE
jgi:hypothetical protein